LTIEFRDTVQPAQIKHHLPLHFDVPAGCAGLQIDFAYEPLLVNARRNLLTLTVFDPAGWRGEGHKHEPQQQVILTPQSATPGYVPGALPAGRWKVVINTHMVLAEVAYRLDITFLTDTPEPKIAATAPGQIRERGQSWYRGDLHGHTWHSDGHWDVPDLVAYAAAQRLDFVTLTDHNTMSGLAQMDSLAAGALLTMGGMELTTFYGHALALGVRNWIDWRVRPGERRMADAVREVEAAGGLFVIAHPMALGDPICTGCDWQYTDVMPGEARCVEIWNGAWNDSVSRNEAALNLWYGWLNQGIRMVATAGSDIHGERDAHHSYGRSVVYADALNERAILQAVRQGHLYLSTAPRLALTALTPDGRRGMLGDRLHASQAQLSADWSEVPAGSVLRWIVNGEARDSLPCENAGSADLALQDDAWALVELRDAAGNMLAITNPIFLSATAAS
jgi:hypothetical protein